MYLFLECSIYPGTYYNTQYITEQSSKPSLQECAKWCFETATCIGWTFVNTNYCFMYSSDEFKGCPDGDCNNEVWISGTKACGGNL